MRKILELVLTDLDRALSVERNARSLVVNGMKISETAIIDGTSMKLMWTGSDRGATGGDIPDVAITGRVSSQRKPHL